METSAFLSEPATKQIARGIRGMERQWESWIDLEDDTDDKSAEYIDAFFASEALHSLLSELSEISPDIHKTYDDGTVKALYPLATFAARVFVAGLHAGSH